MRIQLRAFRQLLNIRLEILDLGLAHRVHELAAKLGRHAAHFGGHLAHLAHDARKFFRPDDDQRHDPDDDELAGIKIKHEDPSWQAPAAQALNPSAKLP